MVVKELAKSLGAIFLACPVYRNIDNKTTNAEKECIAAADSSLVDTERQEGELWFIDRIGRRAW